MTESTPEKQKTGSLGRLFITDEKPRSKSNLAQIASAVIAAIALAGIYVQVSLTRINSLQASARQVYLSYSQATLTYPRLAYPNYTNIKNNTDPTEYMRYKIYVANMLTAYDEIIHISRDKQWVSSFEFDIVDHMPYICEINDRKYFSTFYRATRKLIYEAKKRYCGDISSILRSQPVYPSGFAR
mgnify:CR=1 FL=1